MLILGITMLGGDRIFFQLFLSKFTLKWRLEIWISETITEARRLIFHTLQKMKKQGKT